MKNNPDSGTPVSRRDFVSRLALASAAWPIVATAAHAQSNTAKEKSAASANRAGATGSGRLGPLHVFSKPLQFLSYDETAKIIAEAGFGGIDYTVRPGGHVLPENVKEDLPRAVEAAKKAGLEVEMITTGITSAQDKHTEPLLRTAADLGVKIYRFGNFAYDEKLGVQGSLQKHRKTLEELATLNQSLGIHGAIQNHAGTRLGGAVWDIYEVLHDIDPRWAGVQYDIRHAVAEGGQSWPVALELVAPWIRCIDLKDFKWEQTPGKATIENVPIGEGIVPFDAYFKRVSELNIHGPVSVHFEYPPFARARIPEAEKRPLLLAAMKKDLAALEPLFAKHKLR
ncbi:MAG: sugar phosphate isomerase/epimerase family protein [Opitutaceae bacterium]